MGSLHIVAIRWRNWHLAMIFGKNLMRQTMVDQSQVSIQFLPILACVNAKRTLDNLNLLAMALNAMLKVQSRVDSYVSAVEAFVLAFNSSWW